MADAPNLTLAELQSLIDLDELAKGTKIFHGGQLSNLARQGIKLYGECKGTSATPYRINVSLGPGPRDLKASCTCPAARGRSICKHSAAVLVAWARDAGSFVTSEGPPPSAQANASSGSSATPNPGATSDNTSGEGDPSDTSQTGPGKRKVAQADHVELMRRGLAQVVGLVRDLAAAGVASISDERRQQIGTLAATLRQERLRRLAGRAASMAQLLNPQATREGVDAVAFTNLAVDMLLTARKIEKHLDGEPLDDRYVEELVGRTWGKNERTPIEGLDLVEYAFTTSSIGEFTIRESRFLDLNSGGHFTEKQIVPGNLKTPPPAKRSYAGAVLRGAGGGVYPGFSPRRLDLEIPGQTTELDATSLERIEEHALPDVRAAVTAFQEHRRDLFAPDRLPVAVRIDRLIASGDRVRAVDGSGAALFFPRGAHAEERLWGVLRDAKLLAVLGDIGMDSALPTLTPLAILIQGTHGRELRPLDTRPRAVGLGVPTTRIAWGDVARRSGVSPVAVALGELRDEMATRFAMGLSALSPKSVEPLAARLRACGLEKPAVALESAAQAEASEKLDGFVKVYQVLEVALIRLTSASTVDATKIEIAPSFSCVYLETPSEVLDPGEVLRRRATGQLTRVEGAWHSERYYVGLSDDAYLTSVLPMWADGAASEHVVRVLSRHPNEARELAIRALQSPFGLTAQKTAVKILERLDAEVALQSLRREDKPVGVLIAIEDALDVLHERKRPGARSRRSLDAMLEAQRENLITGGSKTKRMDAMNALFQLRTARAGEALLSSFFHDPDPQVRERAGTYLASMGDPGIIDASVDLVESRQSDGDAFSAVHWLGQVGDSRAVAPLLRAYLVGWRSQHVYEALRTLGLVILDPLVQMLEDPRLASRGALIEVLRGFPDRDVSTALLKRLDGQPGWVVRAEWYLNMSVGWPEIRGAVARRILGLVGDEKSASSTSAESGEFAVIARLAERALVGR